MAAVAGLSSITIWLAALALFYVPQVIAVSILCSSFKGEGGVYLWTRRTQGELPGFMCGWIYWTANLPYLPGSLYFVAATLLLALGHHEAALNPWHVTAIALALLLAIVALNILGLRCGKWITNAGAVSMWIVLLMLVGSAAALLASGEAATPFSAAALVPTFDVPTTLLWATIVFALGGAEGIGFLRSEVKGGSATIVRALLLGGLAVMGAYLVGTVAVLIILSPAEVTVLGGLPEAIFRTVEKVGWSVLAVPALLLLALSALGTTNSWYLASARLPFVAGIDNYLPSFFGRRHPRWGTPYVALSLQAALIAFFLVLSQSGATAKETYEFLIRMGVLGYTLPYFFIFIAAIKVIRSPEFAAGRGPISGRTALVASYVGLAATLSGVAATLVPDPSVPGSRDLTIKILFACAVLLLSGFALYFLARHRRGRAR